MGIKQGTVVCVQHSGAAIVYNERRDEQLRAEQNFTTYYEEQVGTTKEP